MNKTVLKRLITILLSLTLVLSLAACGQGGGTEPAAAPQTESPSSPTPGHVQGEDVLGATGERPEGIQEGSSLSFWLNYDAPNHLPFMDTRSVHLVNQVYENLLYKHHADQNDIRGNLAESWEVSDDGLVWVFRIKQGVRFTSGTGLNAETFVRNWDISSQYQTRFFNVVDKYEATGEYELTVTLSAPSATFIYDLPMQAGVGVVDPDLLEQYGVEDNRSAVGTGPYYIDSYSSGEGYVLKANTNYHNPDRMPSIETCNLVIIPDENTAVIALLNGELDVMNTVNIEVYNTLISNGWDVTVIDDRVNPFWLNAREVELFRDDVVREALCHMIDWQAVSDLVYDGMFPVPDSFWVGPGEYPYGENYSYDPELGVKMLEDAGYSKDDIAFTMLADGDFTNMEIAIQAQFQELGFNNIETVTYDGATCYGMLKSGTYEVFPCLNGYGIESPLTCYSMGLLPEGTQRCMWLDYIDEERYEEALSYYDIASSTGDWDTYVDAVSQITRICQEENVALGGLLVRRMYGINPKLGGVYITPIVGVMEFCYIWDTEAAAQ